MKNMKFYTLVFLSLILLTFTSCEKDKSLSEAIIGTWEIREHTIIVYENGIKKESHTQYLKATEKIFQFVSGGAGIYYEFASNIVFNWALSGSNMVISNLYTEDLQVKITIDGKVLVFSYNEIDSKEPSIKLEFFFKGYRID